MTMGNQVHLLRTQSRVIIPAYIGYISALQSFYHRGTPDILLRLSWNPINKYSKDTTYL